MCSDTIVSIGVTSNYTLSAYIYSVIDNIIGDVEYTTVWDQPISYKIDMSKRVLLSNHTPPNVYAIMKWRIPEWINTSTFVLLF